MIMDSVSKSDSIVVITSEVDSDKAPIIVSIKPNGNGKYEMKTLDSNFITSIYGRDNFGNFVERVTKSDNVLYYNKEKSQELFSVQGLQSSQGLNAL